MGDFQPQLGCQPNAPCPATELLKSRDGPLRCSFQLAAGTYTLAVLVVLDGGAWSSMYESPVFTSTDSAAFCTVAVYLDKKPTEPGSITVVQQVRGVVRLHEQLCHTCSSTAARVPSLPAA